MKSLATKQTDMAKILRFLQFLAVATAASCLTTVDKRAAGGYVQNPSGSASFTHYSGCGQPGARPSPHPHKWRPDVRLTLDT